jgi:hypothetical protein
LDRRQTLVAASLLPFPFPILHTLGGAAKLEATLDVRLAFGLAAAFDRTDQPSANPDHETEEEAADRITD